MPSKAPRPSGLTLANTKLNPVGGTLTAKITLAGQTITQDFTPKGDTSLLNISTLPSTANGLLSVEIYQGNVLKFIAKKAQVALKNPAADGIILDDCNILPAPWYGKTNDGSCAWSINEAP